MGSFLEYHNKHKKNNVSEDRETTISNQELSPFMKYHNEIENKTKESKKKKDAKTMFKKGALTLLESDDNSGWIKKSEAYDDDKGNWLTDTVVTVGSSIGDAAVNIGEGIFRLGEGIGDTISYGIADIQEWTGHSEAADATRARTKESTTDKVFSPAEEFLDKNSIFGDKSDSIAEGLGYVAGMTAVGYLTGGAGAGLGVSSGTAATIGTTATTFVSSYGHGVSEALNDGATIEEARVYGAISGAGEAASELMFGGLGKATNALGLSKGIGEFDDMLIGGLTKKIKNKMVKTVLQSGLKATGEGLEEVVSGLISSVGKKVTYMSDKDWSEIRENENMWEEFWLGAITSAISQGPSTLKSIRTGKDYISGRTENEQKVYDSELKSRTESKVRESTIEKAFNEQVKTYEELGIKIKDRAKSVIMQKVEEAYDNGTLDKLELDKKELGKIAERLDTDMKEGNISIEKIREILGENIDVKNDSMLMKSMYEEAQRYEDYQYEKTDNEKVNILMQSAIEAGMSNTSKARKKVEIVKKLVEDTDRQYRFVTPEQLDKMKYNKEANGVIDRDTGDILINLKSSQGTQFIVGHETTHLFDSKVKQGKGQHAITEYTKEYTALQEAAFEYAKIKGIYDSKLQSVTNAYRKQLLTKEQIKEELTADLVGEFLFNDEKFIEHLAVKNRNVFQKIYDYIKHTYKMMKGTDEEKAFEELKSKFEKVYKTVGKTSNQVTEKGARYSFIGEKVTKGNIGAEQALRVAKEASQNYQSKEMIRQETGWFKGKDGKWRAEIDDSKSRIISKLNKNSKYRLGQIFQHDELYSYIPGYKNIRVETVPMLKNVAGSFSKNTGVMKLNNKYLNDTAELRRTILHELQHATQKIEGFKGGSSLKKAGSWFAYYNSPGEIEARLVEDRADMTREQRDKISPYSQANVQYSLSDNQGRKLNKKQQEYFKDSKVRDDDGNLLVMYHGSESKFNEFNSSVNWFTDSEEYSNYYGRKENTIQKALGIEAKKSKNTYKTYLDIKNPKVLGNIDGYINQDFDVKEFIEASDISREDFNKILEEYNTGKPEYEKAYRIYELTNSEVFKNYLIEQGYDGIKANEKGHISYGVFNSNQIKNINNTNPTSNPDIRYSLSEDNKGRKLSEQQIEHYKDVSPELKDENGNLKTYYHGTQRADRVGTIFDPNKATSGPMAFFTDNQDIAKNYSENKSDTSLSREYNTEYDLFKVNGMDLDTYWNSLSAKERIKIKEQANNVGFDEDWENVIYEERASENSFSDEYKWRLTNKYKGNALKSLYSVWIEDGNIMFEDLVKFKQVLELAGVKDVEYLDPYKIDAKVYETYLNIKNPFNTSNISEDMLNQFREASKTAKIGEQYSADMWDKSNISPEAWIAKLENDIENGTAHSWTVIPDWVTNVLKANGYDGIVDTGGKGGGESHQVVIPFYSNQIKSVDNLNPTENDDINLSLTKDTPITGDDIAARDLLKQERPTIEDEIGKTTEEIKTEAPTVEEVITQTPEEKQQGMKEKAKKYITRSKTNFIKNIVDHFGTSKIANTKTLNNVVDNIREDIQQNGPLTKEKADSYFTELYNNLVTIDTLYYDTYKEVKDNIRATKLYISDAIKSDMSDYNGFRKSNMGTLLMTSDSNNLSVDSYYQEMSDLYPELFPEDIINPTDQLEKISEVAKDISKVEMNVAAYNDKYMGEDYRDWARAEFDKDINSFTQDLNLADRYNAETNEKEKIGVDKETVKNIYKQMPATKKTYEKALAKEVLTKKDLIQVDRLLNDEITAQEIPDGLNKKGIMKVASAKYEYHTLQKMIKEYQDDIRSRRAEWVEELVGNLGEWKDKKWGWQYSRETTENNIYDIVPKETAEKLLNGIFRPITTSAKEKVKFLNKRFDTARSWNIGNKKKYTVTYKKQVSEDGKLVDKIVTEKVSESALVQLLGEKKIKADDVKKAGANVAKIENAVKGIRQSFNEVFEMLNDVLLDNGYAPVDYRKDYFPHFTEDVNDTVIGKFAKLLNINLANREDLSTDIAGRTENFKPGKTWFGNILRRTTDITENDAMKGYERYMRGVAEIIYHTKNIQNLRTLNTVVRAPYNDVEIKNRVEEIKESTMSDEEKAIAIKEIYDVASDRSHLSKFVRWLDNYTNLLAGKQSKSDRNAEDNLNRTTLQTMKDIENRIAANYISGNVGVSITNFGPLAQAWGELKSGHLLSSVWQTMKSAMGKDTSYASESKYIKENSEFYTTRLGADNLTETTLDKITKPIDEVLGISDKFTTEVIIRARYNQNLQEGMTREAALEEADRYAESLMADRSEGNLPIAFKSKNPIAKMVNMFQVEVNNQWSYYLKALPRHLQEKANGNKAEIVKKTAIAYTKIMIGSYLFNEMLGAIRGNSTRVLPDPIYIIAELLKGLTDDDDENDADTIIETFTEVAGNVPFMSLPATLLADAFGIEAGDIGRVPISGAIPNVRDIAEDLFDSDMTAGEKIKSIGGELLDTVGSSLIMPYGGSQIKKTVKGLSLYANDLPGSYTDSGDLRYTVETDVGSIAKSALFGAYANPYAEDYIDSGFKTIKKDNIDEMVGLHMNSTEYRQFKGELSKVQDTTDKNGYKQYTDDNGKVYWYDSESETMYDSKYKKTTLTEDDLTKVSKKEEALNYIDSLDLTDRQKNLVANNLNKNSKKKIDMSEYSNYDSYEEYKYARDYPDKYSVISKIAKYDDYVKYKDAISDIKERYSTELGYETEERKAAVQSYIESLDLNVAQKAMVYKMAGGYSIKNYKNYVYNYIESLPIDKEEKYTIWEELFD